MSRHHDLPYEPAGAGWDRLIMTFPLNGVETDGVRIYMHENDASDSFTNNYFVLVNDQGGSRFEHRTLAGALRWALSNSGWGTYSIKEVIDP